MIEVLDLFSAAAGGWSLGMHRAGFTTMAACEVEAWRRALYSENNPNVKVYDDVRTLTADRLLADLGRLPSVVVGSPPCQDISSANTKGRGVEGERSGLYFEAVRIIGECRPRWFALENSANLRTRGYDSVQAALEAVGYTCWPCVVRAGDIDANHDRARAWVLGCDLTQVADPDGERWDEGRSRGWGRLDVSVSADTGDAAQDGCRQGVPRRRAGAVTGAEQPPRRDAGNADREPSPARIGAPSRERPDDIGSGQFRPDSKHGGSGPLPVARPTEATNTDCQFPDVGAVEPGAQGQGSDIPGDGASNRDSWAAAGAGTLSGRFGRLGDEQSAFGQVGVCAPNRSTAFGHRADWSLADLADHLRLDDGLSTRLAGHRVDIGDGKGQSAASLIVEAFGDAVIPQIPEAIGRAILRTERALSEIYGRAAA